MRVQFLGTSAGELYPGLWCRCGNCQRARAGAPSDRRQSAALYVEPGPRSGAAETAAPGRGVLIDFPSEIASQAHRHGVDLPGLEALLVTHSHGDHWFPYLLRWRSAPARLCRPGEAPPPEYSAPRFTALPTLHVWGNAAVEAVLRRELGDDLAAFALAFHPAGAGETFAAGGFSVTALAANHDVGREGALHYVLQDGRRTLLYGLDGDSFLPATRQALRAFRFDAVVLEATFGEGDGGNHRNFDRLVREADWLREEGLMTPAGQVVASHLSPHHCPPHRETEERLRPHRIAVAWDGLEIDL